MNRTKLMRDFHTSHTISNLHVKSQRSIELGDFTALVWAFTANICKQQTTLCHANFTNHQRISIFLWSTSFYSRKESEKMSSWREFFCFFILTTGRITFEWNFEASRRNDKKYFRFFFQFMMDKRSRQARKVVFLIC